MLLSLALAALASTPPATAESSVMLSTKRARGKAYAAELVRAFAADPDLAPFADAGVDILTDFDGIVLGSEDMRAVASSSFMVVDYALTRDEMKAQVETALATRDEVISWEDHDGVLAGNPVPKDGSVDLDDRWFVLAKDPFLVLAPSDLHEGFLSSDADATAKAFVRRVQALRGTNKGIARMEFSNLPAALKKRSSSIFSLPVDAVMSFRRRGELSAALSFATQKEASAFEHWWETDLRKFIDENLTVKLMFGGLYSDTQVGRSKRRVELEVKLSTEQAQLIARTAADVAEREQARIRARRKARGAQTPQQPGATPAQP